MADRAIATESVRMYVMSPTGWPSTSTPSYSRCATDIVRFGPNEGLRLASCWSVLVVKGGAGERLLGRTLADTMRPLPPRSSST
jgi:hypothetical protein